jgi:hypothetical protein
MSGRAIDLGSGDARVFRQDAAMDRRQCGCDEAAARHADAG